MQYTKFTPALAALVLMSAMLTAATSSAAFTQNARRYLAPKDIFILWTQKFPILTDAKKGRALNPQCWAINAGNLNVIGAVNPVLGKPSVESPAPGFVRWLGSCTAEIVSAELEDLKTKQTNEKLWHHFWPEEVLSRFRDTSSSETPYRLMAETAWSKLSQEMQKAVVRHVVEEWIGPEVVIKDLGFARNAAELNALVLATLPTDASLTMTEALKGILLATALREEFITY